MNSTPSTPENIWNLCEPPLPTTRNAPVAGAGQFKHHPSTLLTQGQYPALPVVQCLKTTILYFSRFLEEGGYG